MTRPPDTAWDYPGLAYCGAVTGVIVEIAYNIHAIRIGSFDATYLFRHILIEAVIFAAVGAILAFTSSFISNCLLQRQ